VVTRLHGLDAQVVTCERRQGERGDPCYLRFKESVSAGALPFCCQGSDNALTVEGGATLTWEVLDRLRESPPDRVFVQVGGGAFAASCARAWDTAKRVGLIARLPRLHPVQTAGGFPLARAWAMVAVRTLEAMLLESDVFESAVPGEVVGFGAQEVMSALRAFADARGDDEASIARAVSVEQRALRACAEALASEVCHDEARQVLQQAARRRSSFMWPWEREPHSRAHGILDDETYDWREVLEGTIASAGWPIVVSEEQVDRANSVGREATGIDADHTGTAGLAGLLALIDVASGRDPLVAPDERILVVFSGVRRSQG
jgi:threonine synthase